MPKRSNPFAESFSPQLKMHIGIKEVDMGVNWKDNMKTVYDRTQDLLFQGVKKQVNQSSKILNKNIKQNNWLHLMRKEKSDLNEITKQNFMIPKQPHCSFCDRLIQINSQRICEQCNGEFCQLCSILRYDHQEETAICLSCLKS